MRRRVLVVDDEPDLRLLLRFDLEADGFEVTEAASGEEALARIEEEAPDLVLLDLRMPGLDGWDVLRHLGAAGRLGNGIKVVAISAHAAADAVARALELGCDRYVRKPFSYPELREVVVELLGGGAQDAPPQIRS